MTAHNKGGLIDALALAIEERQITLIDDPALIPELLAYETQRLPSGLWQYGAPSGAHDDCVIALALAWHAATRGRMASIRPYA